MVELPELFICRLLHASERPVWLGLAALSRATLSNNSWLSSGERPGPRELAERVDLGLRRRGQ